MRNFIVKHFFYLFCLVSDYAYGCLNMNINVYNTLDKPVTIDVSNNIDVRALVDAKMYKVIGKFNLNSNQYLIFNILKASDPDDKDFFSISINNYVWCKCGFKPYKGDLNYYPSLTDIKTDIKGDVSVRVDKYGNNCMIIGNQRHVNYENFSYFSDLNSCLASFEEIEYIFKPILDYDL